MFPLSNLITRCYTERSASHFNCTFESWSLTLFLTLINTPSKNKPNQLRSPSSSPWAIRSLCLRFGALTLHSLCFQWTGWELCNSLAVKAWLCLRILNALYVGKQARPGQARPGLSASLWPSVLKHGGCRSSKAHQCFYDVRGWIRNLAAAVGLRLGSHFFPAHAGIWSVYRTAGANLCSLHALRLPAADTWGGTICLGVWRWSTVCSGIMRRLLDLWTECPRWSWPCYPVHAYTHARTLPHIYTSSFLKFRLPWFLNSKGQVLVK